MSKSELIELHEMLGALELHIAQDSIPWNFNDLRIIPIREVAELIETLV